MALLEPTDRGLYCAAGDFYIDPWRTVENAVVTHAHSDHARWGCTRYLCSSRGVRVLHERVGLDAAIQGIPFGETISFKGVKVTLFPAGHILGSAQVRVEHGGEVWVVSGDYKTAPDSTCDPFEPVKCHTFITESTFGLPIYRWRPERELFDEINAWWAENVDMKRVSVVFAYSLGKAQRVLSGLDPAIGPIVVHGAVARFLPIYRHEGVALPETITGDKINLAESKGRALIIAPPSTSGQPWLRKFGPASLSSASGWMAVRGNRRRSALDRGFILSDHADWPGLLEAISATGAERVGVTHGFAIPLSRYLVENGTDAYVIPTRFRGELNDDEENESLPPDSSANPVSAELSVPPAVASPDVITLEPIPIKTEE